MRENLTLKFQDHRKKEKRDVNKARNINSQLSWKL